MMGRARIDVGAQQRRLSFDRTAARRQPRLVKPSMKEKLSTPAARIRALQRPNRARRLSARPAERRVERDDFRPFLASDMRKLVQGSPQHRKQAARRQTGRPACPLTTPKGRRIGGRPTDCIGIADLPMERACRSMPILRRILLATKGDLPQMRLTRGA